MINYEKIKSELDEKISIVKEKIAILDRLKNTKQVATPADETILRKTTPLEKEEIALILNYKAKSYAKRGKNYQAVIIKGDDRVKLINTIKQNVANNIPFNYDLIVQAKGYHSTPVHINFNGKKLNLSTIDASGSYHDSIGSLLDSIQELDSNIRNTMAFTAGNIQKDNFSCAVFSIQDLDSMLKLENTLDQFLPNKRYASSSDEPFLIHPRFLKNSQSNQTIKEYITEEAMSLNVNKDHTLTDYIEEHSVNIGDGKTRNYAITHKTLKYLEAASKELEEAHKLGGEEAVQALLKQRSTITAPRLSSSELQAIFTKLQNTKSITVENLNELLSPLPVGIDSQDKNLRTLLHVAVAESDTKIVEELLKSDKINPNLIDSNGQTALHIAAAKKNDKMVEILLQSETINPTLRDLEGKTPLDIAKEKGDPKSIESLEKYQQTASNIQNFNGKGALHIAAAFDSYDDTLEILLKNDKTNLNLTDDNGQTALHIAAQNNSVNAMEALLEKNIDINICDRDGKSALHIATEKPHLEAVKTLLKDDNINPNLADNKGQTALHIAAKKDFYDGNLTDALLESNTINPNLTDINGQTALHIAAQHGQRSTLYNFFEYASGLDVYIQDKNGRTALDVAKPWAKDMIQDYIKTHPKNISNSPPPPILSQEEIKELAPGLSKISIPEGASSSSSPSRGARKPESKLSR